MRSEPVSLELHSGDSDTLGQLGSFGLVAAAGELDGATAGTGVAGGIGAMGGFATFVGAGVVDDVSRSME